LKKIIKKIFFNNIGLTCNFAELTFSHKGLGPLVIPAKYNRHNAIQSLILLPDQLRNLCPTPGEISHLYIFDQISAPLQKNPVKNRHVFATFEDFCTSMPGIADFAFFTGTFR